MVVGLRPEAGRGGGEKTSKIIASYRLSVQEGDFLIVLLANDRLNRIFFSKVTPSAFVLLCANFVVIRWLD